MFAIPQMSECQCNEGLYTKQSRKEEQLANISAKCHSLVRLRGMLCSLLRVCVRETVLLAVLSRIRVRG